MTRYTKTHKLKTYNFPYVKYRNGCPVTFFKNKVVYAEQHEKVLKELAAVKAELSSAKVEADSLCLSIFNKEYKHRPGQPQIELSESVTGVILQISNMVAGMGSARDQKEDAL